MVEAMGGDFCQLLDKPIKSWMKGGSILFLPYQVEFSQTVEREIERYLGVKIKYIDEPISV